MAFVCWQLTNPNDMSKGPLGALDGEDPESLWNEDDSLTAADVATTVSNLLNEAQNVFQSVFDEEPRPGEVDEDDAGRPHLEAGFEKLRTLRELLGEAQTVFIHAQSAR